MASGDSSNRKDVTEFLCEKEYRRIKSLGKGNFGEVLSVISLKKNEVAIEVDAYENFCHIDEYIWPV